MARKRKSYPRMSRPGQRYCNICTAWWTERTPENRRESCPWCVAMRGQMKSTHAQDRKHYLLVVTGQAERVERYRALVAAGLPLFEGRYG